MFKLDTDTDFYAADELIRKKVKNAVIETWTCFDGEFEGIVYVMEKAKSEELAEKQAEEWNAVEDWWQRYHAADEETKRMMRCGALP